MAVIYSIGSFFFKHFRTNKKQAFFSRSVKYVDCMLRERGTHRVLEQQKKNEKRLKYSRKSICNYGNLSIFYTKLKIWDFIGIGTWFAAIADKSFI